MTDTYKQSLLRIEANRKKGQRTVCEMPKHDFKPHEWIQCIKNFEILGDWKERIKEGLNVFPPLEYGPAITKKLLIEELEDYARGFGFPVTEADVDYFLELKHWLFPGPHPEAHHCNCIATIICTGGHLTHG